MMKRIGYALMAVSISMGVKAAPLTLDSALEHLHEHPQWQAAQAAIEQAHAERTTAGQYVNPTLDLVTETYDKQTIGLAFPLETASVRQYRQQGADYGIAFAIQQAEFTQRQLKAQIQRTYLRIVQRQQELLLATDELALLEKLRHAVQLKVNVGESPRYEGVKAQAEWLGSKTRFQSAQQQLKLAQQQLAELLGLNTLPEIDPHLPSDDRLCQLPQQNAHEVLAQYPLYQAAQAHLAKDQAATRYEESLVMPQPTLLIGGEHEPGLERLKVGVSLPLPLFNQRDGQIATARAKQKQSEATVHLVDRNVKQAWSEAVMRYQSANTQLASYEAGLLTEAETAFNVAQSAYKYGERSILDFIDAQRTLASVKRGYLTNQFERRYACIDLQQLMPSSGD